MRLKIYKQIVEILRRDTTEVLIEDIDLMIKYPVERECAMKKLWGDILHSSHEIVDHDTKQRILETIKRRAAENNRDKKQ